VLLQPVVRARADVVRFPAMPPIKERRPGWSVLGAFRDMTVRLRRVAGGGRGWRAELQRPDDARPFVIRNAETRPDAVKHLADFAQHALNMQALGGRLWS
jgi:hypothetical protein